MQTLPFRSKGFLLVCCVPFPEQLEWFLVLQDLEAVLGGFSFSFFEDNLYQFEKHVEIGLQLRQVVLVQSVNKLNKDIFWLLDFSDSFLQFSSIFWQFLGQVVLLDLGPSDWGYFLNFVFFEDFVHICASFGFDFFKFRLDFFLSDIFVLGFSWQFNFFTLCDGDSVDIFDDFWQFLFGDLIGSIDDGQFF